MQITINLATHLYYNRRKLRILFLFIIALFVMLLFLAINRLLDYRRESTKCALEISVLDKRLAGHPSGVSEKEFDLHTRQLARLNILLAQRRQTDRTLLDSLETSMPGGVSYTLIVPNRTEKTVKLEGRVRSLSLLSDLLDRLGNAPGIKKPTLLSTDDSVKTGKPGEQSGIIFVISAEWDRP